METVEKRLSAALGLTETETSIYLACLPYNDVGVQQIVTLTSIKRTTVYHAMDTLVYKGLASKKMKGNKAVFSMLAPHLLSHTLSAQEEKIKKQKQQLKDVVPELKLLKKDTVYNTRVDYYEGVSGVKAIYEEALYCRSRTWYSINPMGSFLTQYGKDFHMYVSATKTKRKLMNYALWEQKKADKERDPNYKPGSREVRVMPKTMQGRFTSKIILFDKKVAIANSAHDPGGVIISSEDVFNAFKATFDTVWEISEPFMVQKQDD